MTDKTATYKISVIELQGPVWSQGELLAEAGPVTAQQIGDLVQSSLEGWIARCDTGEGGEDEFLSDGESYPPALEINVTKVLD